MQSVAFWTNSSACFGPLAMTEYSVHMDRMYAGASLQEAESLEVFSETTCCRRTSCSLGLKEKTSLRSFGRGSECVLPTFEWLSRL